MLVNSTGIDPVSIRVKNNLKKTYLCETQRKFDYMPVKPRANGRIIVGKQLPTLLDVICCVRLHTLLRGVGSFCTKFETGQTFSYVQTDATTSNSVGPLSRERYLKGREIHFACSVWAMWFIK